MTKSLIGEIFLPVLNPVIFEKRWKDLSLRVFEELLSLGSIQVCVDEDEIRTATIDSSPPRTSQIGAQLSRVHKGHWGGYKYIRLSASTADKPRPCYDENMKVIGHVDDVSANLLEEALAKRASDLVAIANLSCPGSIEIGSPVTFVNGRLRRTYQYMRTDILRLAVDEALKRGWPKFLEIPIAKTVQWISTPKWLLDQVGGSPVVRALNGFTYLFGAEPQLDALGVLYALMGIEALYTKGEDHIGEQIVNKTQIVLGTIDGLKKRMSQMYGFRSRLVHGQMDFYPCYASEWELPRQTFLEYSATNDLAISILMATLQTMISHDWKTLTFDYSLRETKK